MKPGPLNPEISAAFTVAPSVAYVLPSEFVTKIMPAPAEPESNVQTAFREGVPSSGKLTRAAVEQT
jgi:hypothetical protein